MSDELDVPPAAPPALIKSHQFPVPHLRLPWNDTATPEVLASMPAELAAVASREVLRLRADLADGRSVRFVATALDAVYQRLVGWRQALAVELHHLDGSEPAPEDFVAPMSPTDRDAIARYGAVHPVTGEPGRAARASMAIDAIARARHRVVAPDVQHMEAPLVLRNLVTLDTDDVRPSNAVLLGGRPTWRFAPGARGPVPTPLDPYDPGYDRCSAVIPAALETEQSLHEAAVGTLAQMLVDPDATQIPERFAFVAYLLFHAPLHRNGSDDVIRAFLATTGHLLFAAPVVLPHDVDAQAQVRPQSDIADVQGFVRWFTAQLPPALPRRQRNRRLGPPPLDADRPSVPAPPVTVGRGDSKPTTPPARRRPAQASAGGGGGSSGGSSDGGSSPADMAMMGQLMYAMYMGSQMLQAGSGNQEFEDDIDHAVDVVESWF